MKTLGTTLIAALCVAPAMAAKPINTSTGEGCPVSIVDFQTGPMVSQIDQFAIHYKNNSDKRLLGVKFGIDVMDGVGDFSPYLFPVSSADNTKPGKSSQIVGRIIPADLFQNLIGFRVTVQKLQFEDGSTWEDDGTKCNTVHDYRR